jgi:hypothetical protein
MIAPSQLRKHNAFDSSLKKANLLIFNFESCFFPILETYEQANIKI